jgi:O-antigen/teichoic acid export membrane protein
LSVKNNTRLRLAKNAIANLARGGAAGIVAVFLPAVLVRHMTQLNYSVWVLVLQVAAYSGYLEFGLQTAVGRYIAVTYEDRDTRRRDAIYSTAIAGLGIAAVIGIFLLIGASVAAGWLFPQVPHSLLLQMRWALLIVGASIALGLPSSAWSGVFIGLQRNEFIAFVNGGSKLISALALVLVVLHGASLVVMAMTVGAVNVAAAFLLYLLARRVSGVAIRPGLISRSIVKELFGYCSGLMVWSFAMMLVGGLDLILVGRFQLEALAPYAVAATLITFIAGVQNAVFGAMMPHAAGLHARGDSAALGSAVISATHLGVFLLILTGMPPLIYAGPLLRLWVGQQYAIQGRILLAILIFANIIRLSGVPYATVLVAAAQQRLVTVSPLIEGFSNLTASVLLGARFGARGVAAGTLIGAVIGLLGHIAVNIPRTQGEIHLRARHFVLAGLAPPWLTVIPLAALALYGWKHPQPSLPLFLLAFILTLALGASLIPRFGPNNSWPRISPESGDGMRPPGSSDGTL